MNNGHTRESRHRIAVLENEEVETFVGFCEFAYTGDYSVPVPTPGFGSTGSQTFGVVTSPLGVGAVPPPAPSPPATPGAAEEQQDSGTDNWGDSGEGEPTEGSTQGGPSAEAEKPSKKGKKGKKKGKGGAVKAVAELEEGAGANLTPPRTPPPGERSGEAQYQPKEDSIGEPTPGPEDFFDIDAPKTPTQAQQPEAEVPHLSSPPPPRHRPSFPPKKRGGSLWDDFTDLHYIKPKIVPGPKLPTQAPPYILFHAKLYVFATRYLIPTLAQLSLNKLHKDLLSFPLIPPPSPETPIGAAAGPGGTPPTNVPAVLQLLHFTFTRTTREDPVFHTINPSTGQNELRKLVTHYAACKVRDLAGYDPPVPVPMSLAAATAAAANGNGSGGGGSGYVDVTKFGFRELLDGIGELASDLVYCLM